MCVCGGVFPAEGLETLRELLDDGIFFDYAVTVYCSLCDWPDDFYPVGVCFVEVLCCECVEEEEEARMRARVLVYLA